VSPGGAARYHVMMETGDKETLEGKTIKQKRKRSDGMNIDTTN
jgi:hypothetical protein